MSGRLEVVLMALLFVGLFTASGCIGVGMTYGLAPLVFAGCVMFALMVAVIWLGGGYESRA